MSPLERVIPLSEFSKIRVECSKCHTIASFPVTGHTYGNVGERCPFCMNQWESVERILLDVVKSLERNRGLKSCKISLETEEAF